MKNDYRLSPFYIKPQRHVFLILTKYVKASFYLEACLFCDNIRAKMRIYLPLAHALLANIWKLHPEHKEYLFISLFMLLYVSGHFLLIRKVSHLWKIKADDSIFCF